MEAFAYATLFTYLIWFLSCEASNAKLRYRLKDYVAMFVLFLAYFSFGMMFEPVIGLCLYVAVYVVTIRLFMPDVWNFAFDIVKSLHGNRYTSWDRGRFGCNRTRNECRVVFICWCGIY